MDQFRMVFSFLCLLGFVSDSLLRYATNQSLEQIITAGFGVDLLTSGVVCCGALIAARSAVCSPYGDSMSSIARCLTVEEAFRSIKGRQLLSIVGAIGLGIAMNSTGLVDDSLIALGFTVPMQALLSCSLRAS